MKLIKKIKGSKSICWMTDDSLLVYRKRRFYIYNVSNSNKTLLCEMPMNVKQKIISMFKITRRIFRAYPQSPALSNDKSLLFFSFLGGIYSLNFNDGFIVKEGELNHNAKRVLSFCTCQNGDVYYGEYPTHYDRQPICIYKRVSKGKWQKTYSFNPNEIRHIHLILEDNDNLYCFTGDEDNETRIILFKHKDFRQPIILASGSQNLRSCVALINEDKDIYYLTDTPYFENKIYCLKNKSVTPTSMCSIEGTVIYGLKDDHTLYFSTVVEHNLKKTHNNKNKKIKIDGVNGGIKNKRAIIYKYDVSNNVLSKIYSIRKDLLSYKYFGLGTFVFTANNSKKYLAATASCLKKDENIMIFEKQNN